MNFLNDTEQEPTLLSPMTARTPLSREEVDRQKSKADNITWFTHNEFIWRSGASIVWFLFLLPIACILYIAVVSFSLVQPVTWIADLISNVFSLWNMSIYIFTFGIIMMPVLLINIYICSVEVKFGLTRIAAIASFLTAKHLYHLILCMLSGSVATWWISSLTYTEYGMLTQNCSSPCIGESESSRTCFNETSLFLAVFGTILGVRYAISFFQENHHQIKFPVVQQERIFRLKACLVPCFWQAVIICLKSFQICYPLYFLFGSFARNIVRVLTGLDRDRELPPLDSIYGLLDIRLFWFCFITGTFVAYMWTLANKLFIIFQTEVLRFPIQAALAEHLEQSLPVVLKCQTVPLLKYLAFNDLCQLSQFSAKRRKKIFSLSIPGGRPLNWLWVSDECLTLLNELKERISLDNYNKHALPHEKQTDSAWRTPSRTIKDVSGGQSLTKETSSTPFLRHTTRSSNTTTGSQSQPDTPKGNNLTVKNQVKHPNKLIEKVKRFPLVRFFFKKREEAHMEDLFYDAQLQIWAADVISLRWLDSLNHEKLQLPLVKGLSRLVAASFVEDVYGVVQKTLPLILSSLLELLQAVEIYLKKPLSQQNLFRVRHPSEIRKTVFVLRDCLRCSIYRITETFQQHLSDIELTANNKEFLKTFFKFQE